MTARTYLIGTDTPTDLCIITEDKPSSNTTLIIREWDHKRKFAGIFLVSITVPTIDLPSYIANIFASPSTFLRSQG